MLKTIFLGPGRFFCGEAVDDGSRHRRYRLSAFRQRGPVLVVSIAFWLILMAGGVVLCATLGTNVDPPPKKSPANLKAPPAVVAQPAVNLTTGQSPLTGPLANSALDPKLSQESPAPATTPAGTPTGTIDPAARATTPTKEPYATPPKGATGVATPVAPPEIWLVIVASIPKSARGEAERTLAQLKKKGLALELLDTDAFPKLKSGMWALALSPFDTKKEAEAAALAIKKQVKSLMVRRGL